MRRATGLLLSVFLVVLGLPAVAAAAAEPAANSPATALRCGRLLDPASGKVTADAVVLVRGERIERVGTAGGGLDLPAGTDTVDLSRYTCLPGLIDSHTHVLLQPEDEGEVPPVITKSQAFRTVQGVAAARRDLEAGFTTLRDLDSEGAGFADVAIRDGINQGVIPGPRLYVSTHALTITGGHMNLAGMNPDLALPDPATLTDSRAAMIAEVRREVKYGADWIKVYATGTLRHVDPVTLESLSQFSEEDLRAVVEEARRWHRDVAAHAYGGEGAKNAIRAGVRSIEHGMLMDDETIDLLVRHGTWWCPTLSVYIPGSPAEDTELRRRIVAHHKEVFQKAMRKKVKIAFGTDVGAFEHGTAAREMVRMAEYGMSPLDVLRTATVNGAELLRMEKDIGTVEPGKYADVIAVVGDPLSDIGVLANVANIAFVMKAGRVYKAPSGREDSGQAGGMGGPGPSSGSSQGERTMYGLIGKMTAVPGKRDELLSILLEGMSGMPGCLSYVVAKDPADADAIWITEVWDSEESHRAALSLPAVQQAIARGKPLIAGFGDSAVTEPVGGHGLVTTKAEQP